MKHKRSPLAPKKPAVALPVKGVRLATLATNLRYKNREDFLLAAFAPGTQVAGVFTQSLAPAAPVLWCRAVMGKGKARALVVNAGNANAATGKQGQDIVIATAKAAAQMLGCAPADVLQASTGIIGQPLKKNALADFVPKAAAALKLGTSPAAWTKASEAIMTTDTFPKLVSRTAKIGGKQVTITGFCKGSGMIAPNMATLLSFIFTDATIPSKTLQALLKAGVDKSFNSITVDSDTSTNDTLLAFATGQVKHDTASPKNLKEFTKVFEDVLLEMAQLVVKDGEGAQKFITIDVTGAANDEAARTIGLTIANSPLVKTALAAGDANWGRILAAAGRAGEKMNQDKAAVSMGGIAICRNGGLIKGYKEAPVAKHLKGREVSVSFDAGVGKGRARVYTCDLTHGYIDINASYRS
jgi:glutamate N-acetyltransferase/amino-acid N-acetyltransferase